MARPLSIKAVEAWKHDPARRIEIQDAGFSSVYLLMQPSGAKSWALRYGFAGKLTLGRWPVMGLVEARAAASAAVEQIHLCQDSSVAQTASKAARLDGQLSERDKIKTLVEQFDNGHLYSLRSGKQVRQHLDRFVVSSWGKHDIQSITRRDVVELLDGQRKRPARKPRPCPSASSSQSNEELEQELATYKRRLDILKEAGLMQTGCLPVGHAREVEVN